MKSNLWEKEGFSISTDRELLDKQVIFNYLNRESYWANGIPMEIITKSIENTFLCFGVYEGNPQIGKAKQIGFARVISDLATFAYLADVFILEPYRGKGLSKWLMRVIVEHSELQMVRRFMLATNDAHTLYSQYGFEPLNNPSLFMQIVRNHIYQKNS
ncbi:GNAT family N-acetyltransferase [Ammoniphilus sp. YIM 78166]|uniref:GNAT family N-acetyltransferase n=1 Tax=Ammoniphilus sp. YIM 78166 TaxID=1644106 RepID=UPI0010702697|nr:GNAT family N-acetyltransferase [Ammoniphilus sp. YIM 78166]